jgi:hypothetical protein
MNNKKLAEMIKKLRKERMEMNDMNTTSNMKGASRDVAEDTLSEFKRGAIPTHFRVAKKLAGALIKASSELGNQRNRPDRYKLTEKKEEKANTKSSIINTTPEQDSAMVGTQ